VVAITDPNELTPVELRNGRFYKREDLHRNEKYGVNGAKFRACRHLMTKAVEDGAMAVVSASSVLSPQAAMAGVLAEELGLDCTLLFGSTKPETAPKHVSVRIALEAGATMNLDTKVAYNPVIQKAGNLLAKELGAWQLPYGITTEANAPAEEVEAFLQVGGAQVENLPAEVETLVIPFGSGNTATGVLYGLHHIAMPDSLKRVVLVGVGPDRLAWMKSRLDFVGINMDQFSFEIVHMPLHGWFADYGDKMPETADGIVMHPTYEGKVVRFLNGSDLEWWHARDGKTCFWIVGGPIA
jgi:hypothetical protein